MMSVKLTTKNIKEMSRMFSWGCQCRLWSISFSSVSAWLGGAAIGVAPAAAGRAGAVAPVPEGRGLAGGRGGERAGAALWLVAAVDDAAVVDDDDVVVECAVDELAVDHRHDWRYQPVCPLPPAGGSPEKRIKRYIYKAELASTISKYFPYKIQYTVM
jgi:hypothetical protein